MTRKAESLPDAVEFETHGVSPEDYKEQDVRRDGRVTASIREGKG